MQRIRDIRWNIMTIVLVILIAPVGWVANRFDDSKNWVSDHGWRSIPRHVWEWFVEWLPGLLLIPAVLLILIGLPRETGTGTFYYFSFWGLFLMYISLALLLHRRRALMLDVLNTTRETLDLVDQQNNLIQRQTAVLRVVTQERDEYKAIIERATGRSISDSDTALPN